MKMNRRELLIGSAVTAVAMAAPNIVLAHNRRDVIFDQLAKNTTYQYRYASAESFDVMRFDLKLLRNLVDADLFEQDKVMNNVTVEYRGNYISSGSRCYKTGYTAELVQDLRCIVGIDAEAELLRLMTEELKIEITKIVALCNHFGRDYLPYVPIYSRKTINSETFEPEIRFKTRYGIS